jgi:hypothetical protein
MGCAFLKHENEVHIMQSGGCAGGGECSCNAARFDDAMDPKLQPYITEQEYKAVLDKAGEAVRAHGARWQWWAIGIPLCVLSGVFGAFAKGESFECTAANKECQPGQTPEAGQCCSYTCCPKARRLEELGGSSGASDFLSASGPEDTTRSLLTGRRAAAAFACFVDDATEKTECMCRTEGSGKHTREVCDGTLTISGEHIVHPPVVWPIPIMVLGIIAGLFFTVLWPLWKLCSLKAKVSPFLEPWRQKGLVAEYRVGNKQYRARIAVFTPKDGSRVLGAQKK